MLLYAFLKQHACIWRNPLSDVRTFWGQTSKSIFARGRSVLLYLIFPLVATAVMLFYLGENPPSK